MQNIFVRGTFQSRSTDGSLTAQQLTGEVNSGLKWPQNFGFASKPADGETYSVRNGGNADNTTVLIFESEDAAPSLNEDESVFWGMWGGAKATGTVTVTGIPGSIVPLGTVLKYNSEIEYEVLAPIVLNTASVVGSVQAVKKGVDGNRTAGDSLTFVSAPLGINDVAIVAGGGLTGGMDKNQTQVKISEGGTIEITGATAVNVNGDVTATGNVSDSNATTPTMANIRTVFNSHTHGGGATPDQSM